MSKLTIKSIILFQILLLFGIVSVQAQAEKPIIHDGEYNYLASMYGEKWAKEDKEIDA